MLNLYNEWIQRVLDIFRKYRSALSSSIMREVYEWEANGLPGQDSISNEDACFIYETCLQRAPSKILEIGTGKGKSTYCLLAASNCPIISIDKDVKWVDRLPEVDTSRIVQYNMHSTEYLHEYKNQSKFDFLFADANLNRKDIQAIFDFFTDNFTVVMHDYYWQEKDKVEKGQVNTDLFVKIANVLGYRYKISFGGYCCVKMEFYNESF